MWFNESNRDKHKGIISSVADTSTLSSEYLYSTMFTYDDDTGEFTLVDPIAATWRQSTYLNLLGMFTCKNNTGKCSTIYSVNGYYSYESAYTAGYSIGDTNYTQIGKSSFNANYRGLTMAGYMFSNKIYTSRDWSLTSGSLVGNDVSYSNGRYTLLPASGENELGTTIDDNHHYTCNTTSSICTTVRYYYSQNNFIELNSTENIQVAIDEMLYSDNVNTYNSSIKGIIEAWYANNLADKNSMLEDAVFCNSRDMINQSTNGWNKDGSLSTTAKFRNSANNDDLSCANITDQFAVGNSKAKLAYPVALPTEEELYSLTNNNSSSYYDLLTKTNTWYWIMSPVELRNYEVFMGFVYSDGSLGSSTRVSYTAGVRPVVSLSPNVIISKGTGSETDPWIVD